MKSKLKYGLVVALCLAALPAWTDSLELKNGSLINGRFVGGTETEIVFRVGSSVQKYNLSDIVSLKFGSEAVGNDTLRRRSSLSNESDTAARGSIRPPEYVTIPAGTRISVRTIDAIDSATNQTGDRFQASLEEPLTVDGNVVSQGNRRLRQAGRVEGIRQVHRQIATATRAYRDCGERTDRASRNRRI